MAEAAFDRARALERLGMEAFDVLVIGGGATGAGVAIDAATRGLRTALVERGDFATGTSSKSSKLIHGGIRYLAQGDVKLVYQALTERRRLLRNAPHLVRILGFMLPIYRKGGLIPRFFARGFGLVLWFYDLTGGAVVVGRHRRLSRDEVRAQMPTLKSDQIVSGYLYYDARVDDARLTLAIARTAADHGAAVASYCRVTEIRKNAGGKAIGATVDTGAGNVDISARVIVNAAGVWVDDVGRIDVGPGHEMMRPARGVHRRRWPWSGRRWRCRRRRRAAASARCCRAGCPGSRRGAEGRGAGRQPSNRAAGFGRVSTVRANTSERE